MQDLVSATLPNTSQLAAFVKPESTIADFILTLLQQDADTIVSILCPQTPESITKNELWAIQRVPRTENEWTDQALLQLQANDGLLDFDAKIGTYLEQTTGSQFSDYARSAHLHAPTFKLVHLPCCLNLNFASIPGIPEDYRLAWFIAPRMSCNEVIDGILDEFGISRTVAQGTKTATIQYALQTSSSDLRKRSKNKIVRQLNATDILWDVLQSTNAIGPPYSVTITLSKAWFDKVGGTLSGSVTERFKRPSLTQSSFARQSRIPTASEAEGEDTIKDISNVPVRASTMLGLWSPSEDTIKRSPTSPVDRPYINTSRLSSFFDGWTSPPSTSQPRSRMVSEPRNLPTNIPSIGLAISSEVSSLADQAEYRNKLDDDFERLVHDLGIKPGPQQDAMRALPDDRKQFLLAQHAAAPARPLAPSKTGADSGVLGGIKRFSMAAISSTWTGVDPATDSQIPETQPSTIKHSHTPSRSMSTVSAIVPTQTGWASWFSAASPNSGERNDTAAWAVAQMQPGRTSQKNMAKHLIALRVRLSTEKIAWIEDFIGASGLQAIHNVLSGVCARNATSKDAVSAELDEGIATECVKCLRIILNTEDGFRRVVDQPALITQIAFCLRLSSIKLKSQAADVLAALCILSHDGHAAVLAAFSDYKVAFDEKFRFAGLLASISVGGLLEGAEVEDSADLDDAGTWEFRSAAMSLINALANGPEDVEDRVMLRDELQRRGLNEVMVALRYCNPPDNLISQLDLYTEEGQEDLEELHERSRGHHRDESTEIAWREVKRLAQDHSTLYPILLETVKRYTTIFERPIDESLRNDLLVILDRFIEHAAHLDNFDDGWKSFMREYLASVEHIVGQQAVVSSSNIADTANIPTSFLDEMQSLRYQVELLNDEKTLLKSQVSEQIAEINTLKALTPRAASQHAETSPAKGGSNESFTGVIQRLVQKEKQVIQLQAELERANAGSIVADDPEAIKKERLERNRQWTNLMDEIGRLKQTIVDYKAIITSRDKDIKFLKRSLESVYIRLHANQEASEQQNASLITAEELASKSMDVLSQRDESIAALTTEVASLKEKLKTAMSHPKVTRGPSFNLKDMAQLQGKIRQAPEPPSVPTSTDVDNGQDVVQPPRASTLAIPIPPPPPPPPPPPFLSQISAGKGPKLKQNTQLAPSLLPPPPPPPPPPLLRNPSSSAPPGPAPPPPPSLQKVVPKPSQSGPPLVKMKPLHWNKVNNTPMVRSVWSECATSNVEIDLANLQSTFAAVPIPSKTANAGAIKSGKQPATLLNVTRANNIGVMLVKSKMSAVAIRTAFVAVEDSKLSIDLLRSLKQNAPTADETLALRNFKGDINTLSKSDQFVKEMLSIPRFAERAGCLIYRRRFEMDLEELRPDVNILKNAIAEVKSSESFKQILGVVLAIGNTLNASTYRGNAQGFQLDALLKLKDTKATTGKPGGQTLLHFLVAQLQKSQPSLLNFTDDMPHLDAASKISLSGIKDTANQLAQGLKSSQEEIQLARQAGIATENAAFSEVMQKFAIRAKPAVEALQTLLTTIEGDITSLLSYYGEDPASAKVEDLFATINSFAASLQNAQLELAETQNRKARMEAPRRQPWSAKLSQTQSPPTSLQPPNIGLQTPDGKRSIGKGDFDNALRDIRSATVRRTRTMQNKPRPLSRIFTQP